MTKEQLTAIVDRLAELDWSSLFDAGAQRYPLDVDADRAERKVTISLLPFGQLRQDAPLDWLDRVRRGEIDLEQLVDEQSDLLARADRLMVEGKLIQTKSNGHTSDYRDAAAAYGEDYDFRDVTDTLFAIVCQADGTPGAPVWYGSEEWTRLMVDVANLRHEQASWRGDEDWLEADEMLRRLKDKHIGVTIADRKSGRQLHHWRLPAHRSVVMACERGVFSVWNLFVSTSGNLCLGWSWKHPESDQTPTQVVALGKSLELPSHLCNRTSVVVAFAED